MRQYKQKFRVQCGTNLILRKCSYYYCCQCCYYDVIRAQPSVPDQQGCRGVVERLGAGSLASEVLILVWSPKCVVKPCQLLEPQFVYVLGVITGLLNEQELRLLCRAGHTLRDPYAGCCHFQSWPCPRLVSTEGSSIRIAQTPQQSAGTSLTGGSWLSMKHGRPH